uniref:Uncharacterized protein n=1 Tax=Acrobeloides nanus TaxID=290746 RepID=A0A914DB88_9BILA
MQIFEESDGNVTNYGNFTPVKRQNVRQDVPLLDNLAHKFQNSQNTIQDQINQLKQDSQPAPVSAQISNNGLSNSASNSDSGNIAAAAALNSGGSVNPINTIVNQNSNMASSDQQGSNSVNASAIGLNNNAGGNGNQDGGETQVVELPGSGTVYIVGPNGNATVIKTNTSIAVSANNVFN